LKKLLIYDKRQPEFIEKTETYIGKRVNKKRVLKAKSLLLENKDLLSRIEKDFGVPKEYLVALWGIETSFGRHLGKVDIISALATLSFDKRRSAYFSKELITILRLIDKKKVKLENLYGSWAGAHGNFQFMPSSIKNYAIDYDKDGQIDLVNSLEDSFASAANYLKTIGWNKKISWGYKVISADKIDNSLVTIDARKLKKTLSRNDLINNKISIKNNKKAIGNFKLIRPDGKDGPIFLVTTNYEKLLNWNRSLRFAITVGLFADLLKNA
jgi:membrane-bound lytic murein transglycosylase B